MLIAVLFTNQKLRESINKKMVEPTTEYSLKEIHIAAEKRVVDSYVLSWKSTYYK